MTFQDSVDLISGVVEKAVLLRSAWPWEGGGGGGGKSQNCTGQKCTEHELVLLMFFVLKCLDDLL